MEFKLPQITKIKFNRLAQKQCSLKVIFRATELSRSYRAEPAGQVVTEVPLSRGRVESEREMLILSL